MPTLRHLLEELKLIDVKTEDARITGKMFNNIMLDIEDQKEQLEEEEKETEENPQDE